MFQKSLATLLLLLALVAPTFAGADALKVVSPKKAVPLDVVGETVTYVKKLPCQVVAKPGADLYIWNVPDAVKATSNENVLTVTEAPNGAYKLSVTALTIKIDFDKKTIDKTKDYGEVTLNVGAPDPPKPPSPPDPPTPPIPAGGLGVLIVYESEDLAKYPSGQLDIIQGQEVRDYLESKCEKEADGKKAAYRIWDKDVSPAGDREVWRQALGRARKSTPWVVVLKGGKVTYEGALPADPASFKALLKTYEGKK